MSARIKAALSPKALSSTGVCAVCSSRGSRGSRGQSATICSTRSNACNRSFAAMASSFACRSNFSISNLQALSASCRAFLTLAGRIWSCGHKNIASYQSLRALTGLVSCSALASVSFASALRLFSALSRHWRNSSSSLLRCCGVNGSFRCSISSFTASVGLSIFQGSYLVTSRW